MMADPSGIDYYRLSGSSFSSSSLVMPLDTYTHNNIPYIIEVS